MRGEHSDLGRGTDSHGARPVVIVRAAATADVLVAHLQLHIDDNLRQGMSEAEARREALLKLGGLEQTKERYRDRRNGSLTRRGSKGSIILRRYSARSS